MLPLLFGSRADRHTHEISEGFTPPLSAGAKCACGLFKRLSLGILCQNPLVSAAFTSLAAGWAWAC